MRTTSLFLALAVTAAIAQPLYAAETCGDGIDNDTDGFADEGCWPAGMHGLCESPISCKVTGDIAPKSGGLVYPLPPDFNPTVPYGPKLEFVRRYQSLYAPPATNYRTSMGPRWTHNFQSWLDKSGTNAIVHLVTGQDVKFAFSNTSGGYDHYTPQAGYHFKDLRQATSSPNNWELITLTGEIYRYNWSSPVGKLIEIQDTVGNKITIAYLTSGGNSGQIDTVTDASGAKRFKFSYSSGRVSSVAYQTISGGTGTTRATLSLTYTSTNPTTAQIGGSTIQTMSYTSNYLTGINDGESNSIIGANYVSATPGMVANVTTGEGGIGFDYNSANAQCTGQTALFFNVANATSCSIDSDCGTGLRCGGKTGSGSTGKCYRAARCLTVTSPSEDLVTTVAPFTPCTGACAPTAEYAWNTSTLDLKGIKKADNNWTSFQRDANGMVVTMAEGDSDNDATNTGGIKTFLFYDSNFPGKLSEIRHQSSIEDRFVCDAGTGVAGCKRTRYNWNATTGLLDSKIDDGTTYNASGSRSSFSYTTGFSYDSVGRRTLISGPLVGVDDNTEFTFHSSSDVFKNGYPNEVKRKKDASNYLTTVHDDYDYFGNAKSQKDPDLTFTCRTFDGNRNSVTEIREAMNGQSSCATPHTSDLVTAFVRDSRLRLTKTTRPFGDCQHKEYDTSGRLSKVKLRDDCVAANAGENQELSYDSNGQVTKGEFKDSSGTVTFRLEGTYHDGLQLNARINPVSTSYSQSMSYAADGEFAALTFENGIGKTEWTFDAQNRETKRTRYLNVAGSANDWDFGYPTDSPVRRFSTVTDDLSKTVNSYFDDLDRRTRVISPESGTTLFVYNEASQLTTLVEASGAGSYAHTFTYDYLGRKLTENYVIESCGFSPTTEVEYTWDASPGTCPVGATCANQTGRLAYVKTVLLCDTSQGDSTLDQMTYYGYDAAGRLLGEYMQDDTSRTANQSYTWDKNGNLLRVTAPSGVAMVSTFGASGNSDANRITTLSRDDGTTTNLATNISWSPFGPVAQYDQANTIGGGVIRAMLTWNLAYRASQIKYRFTTPGTDRTKIDYTEDEKGRYSSKVYSNVTAGMQDDYLQYDWFDRVICDAAVSGTCPSASADLKTSVSTYNASNDRTVFRHRRGSSEFEYTITQVSGTDKISSFAQTGVSGSTTFGWDARGNRTSEDESTSSNDRRDYTWEGRRRLRTVSGKHLVGLSTWQNYTITNTYDHRDRRVTRLWYNTTTGLKSQWFYYYDPQDRIIEIKYVPDISATSTYSLYQFYWLDKRLVSYFGTDSPSGTTGRFFAHSDESNRPLEIMDWPSTGDASVVWAINPDVFGWDTLITGSIFQPFRLNGAYFETSTLARKDAFTIHRPELVTERGAIYDPLAESFLQLLGEWPDEGYQLQSHDARLSLRLLAPASSYCDDSRGGFGWTSPTNPTVMHLDNPPDPAGGTKPCYGECECGSCELITQFVCCKCPTVTWGKGFKRCQADPAGPRATCGSTDPVTCVGGLPVPSSRGIRIY